MEAVYRKGGTKALLTVIGLREAFEEIGDKASKPRVTKNVKILSAVANFFRPKRRSQMNECISHPKSQFLFCRMFSVLKGVIKRIIITTT